jgi:hypothetical protein
MRTNGRTEMTKLIIASYNLAKTPQKLETGFAFEIGPRREIVVFFSISNCKILFIIFMVNVSGVEGRDIAGVAAISIWMVDGPIGEHLTYLWLPDLWKVLSYSRIHPL